MVMVQNGRGRAHRKIHLECHKFWGQYEWLKNKRPSLGLQYMEWSQGPLVTTGFFGPTLLHVMMIFRISLENNETTKKGGCSSSCFNYTLKNHDLFRALLLLLTVVRLTFHQQFHGNYSSVDFISLTFNFGSDYLRTLSDRLTTPGS